MGILDGSYGGGLLDPNTASLLGMAAGMGQASGASRLPISMGQVMGSGIQGMLSGQQLAQQAQLRQAQLTGQQINNANAALGYNLWAPMLGQQPISVGAPGGNGTITPGASAAQGAAPSPPSGSVQAANTGSAVFGSGSSTPPQGMDMMSMLSNMPPPLLQKMGIQVPPELTAAFYAGIKPGSPEYQTIVRNVAIKASGVNPVIGGERAGVPAQNYNLATGNYEPQQGAYDRIYEGARQQGMGALQAKEAEAAYKTGLETGEPTPNVGTGLPTGTTAAQAANPRPLAFKPQGATPGPSSNGDFTTDRGTVVPSAFTNQKMGPGSDLISKQNTESINTERGWAAVRPAIETQRARLGVISDSLADLDAKGFTEARANIANRFHGLGMDGIANAVMSQGNVADVQRILWAGMQDVMQQLKVANAGSGGRILRSEFEAYMEHAFSPDQIGPSLRTAVTQQLGTMYQMGNMIDDYYSVGRQRNWRDANQFQSAYLKKNPIEGFVNYAENTVPQFKGSPGRAAPKLADPLGIR